jgi:translation initiation factor IF-2
MKHLVNIIIGLIANLIPESYPYDARLFTAKILLLGIFIGYLFSFPVNGIFKKTFGKFKFWLKEKRRDRRLAAKKIPGTVFLGEITQFLDKLKVAIIKVKNKKLLNGDFIFVYGKNTKVTFQVNSMQINKNPVNIIKKGDEAGILVPREVHSGDLVYKLKRKPK